MAVVLFVCAIAACVFWTFKVPGEAHMDAHMVPLVSRLLPAGASPAQQAATLGDIAAMVRGSVALYASNGQQIAASSSEMPMNLNVEADEGAHARSRHFSNVLHLPDERLLLLRWGSQAKHIALAWLAAVALLVALGTWPVARRLTRRLERLQQQADAWGEGRLSARMAIDGCDEVAELARRFNQAAERVEALVNGQRAMLAAASHELRSPLARIRMATDLMSESSRGSRPDLQDQISRDIAELDALIGDLLLASRLAEDSPRLQLENIDLLGLAAEEASRVGASAGGEALTVRGDARLLRHLVRNLIDNARRYGAGATSGPSVEIEVTREDKQAVLRVLDRGPGVPQSEREKVFDPFYRLAGSTEQGEGAGYGLALVRRIARLHGGNVHCLPRNGGGACFEVKLPV
jgi:signal transduction histidine kinase